jgi:RNA polymerase sigma factor (sigma-70 family)
VTRPVIDAEVRRQLVRAVRSYCPPWMADQHDDLVQMSAMRILRATGVHDLAPAYLRRVAYTVVIDEIRRRRRSGEVGMSPSMPDRIARSGSLSPESRVRGVELGARLVDCLAELSADRRAAVALYLQSHTVPEISVMLDCDPKRAANLVYRGLADLRAALVRQGIEP